MLFFPFSLLLNKFVFIVGYRPHLMLNIPPDNNWIIE